MCDKVVLDSLGENSGQIEDISNCVYKYNLEDANDVNSLIIMGHKTDTMCNEIGGVVNFMCKPVVNSDESLNYDDISTQDWVKQQTSGSSVDLRGDDLDDNIAVNYTDMFSKDIEGYCIVDCYGQIQSVLTNNRITLPPDISKLNEQDYHLPVEQKVCNKGNVSIENKGMLLNRLGNGTPVEKAAVKVGEGKMFDIIKNVNNVIVSENCRINTSDGKKLNMPFVKIPKKYILSGKIINQNLLSSVSRQRQISILNHKNKYSNNVIKQKKPTSLLKNKTPSVTSDVLSKDSIYQTSSVLNIPQNLLRHSSQIENKKHYKKIVSRSDANIKCSVKKPLPLATVAISTNKCNDTTEIVIKMDTGQELYKGKASDLMKAVNNCVEWKCNVKANDNGSDLAKGMFKYKTTLIYKFIY